MAIDTNIGAFIPSTYNLDVSSIHDMDVNSEEFKRLIVNLYLDINRLNIATNLKDTGYYDQTEFVNGQLFFPNPNLTSYTPQTPNYRQVYRKTINFGPLPNTGSTSVAHNISANSGLTFTRLYGAASDTTSLAYLQLPYASPTLAHNIELSANATTVTITTGSNRSNYTMCYVILEYLKQ